MNPGKINQITVTCDAVCELGASAAVLLAYLCEVHDQTEQKGELLERGFFPCTRQDLTNAIGMLRRQQENAIAELSDKKYVKVKANQPGFNGGIRLFRINKEMLESKGYYKIAQALEPDILPAELSEEVTQEIPVVEENPIIETVESTDEQVPIDATPSLEDLFPAEVKKESKSKKKKKPQTEDALDLFSMFSTEEAPVSLEARPEVEEEPIMATEPAHEPTYIPEPEDELLVQESAPEPEITVEALSEESTEDHTIHASDPKSAFFSENNWITNTSNIIYHPQSQMQQQLAQKVGAILGKDIDIYSKCSDLMTILGIRSQLEYFDMHNLSKCGSSKIQQTIDALLNFAKIAPTLSPIQLKFHQAILVEIIKFIIKGHNRSILSFEYRTESPQPRQELKKILEEHYNDYQFNINIV